MGMGLYLGHNLIPGKKLFWHVWKELLFWIALIFGITTINFVYRYVLLHKVFDIYDIYSIGYIRFLFVGVEVVGITALLLKFFQTMLIKSDMIKAVVDSPGRLDKNPHYSTSQDSKSQIYHVSLIGKNKNEKLKLPLNSIVYLHSTGNYVEVYYENGEDTDQYSKVMIRQSLSSVEKQLSDEDCIARIHKSYLINKNKLTDVKGNSKKAVLVINGNIDLPLRRDLFNLYKQQSQNVAKLQ